MRRVSQYYSGEYFPPQNFAPDLESRFRGCLGNGQRPHKAISEKQPVSLIARASKSKKVDIFCTSLSYSFNNDEMWKNNLLREGERRGAAWGIKYSFPQYGIFVLLLRRWHTKAGGLEGGLASFFPFGIHCVRPEEASSVSSFLFGTRSFLHTLLSCAY